MPGTGRGGSGPQNAAHPLSVSSPASMSPILIAIPSRLRSAGMVDRFTLRRNP